MFKNKYILIGFLATLFLYFLSGSVLDNALIEYKDIVEDLGSVQNEIIQGKKLNRNLKDISLPLFIKRDDTDKLVPLLTKSIKGGNLSLVSIGKTGWVSEQSKEGFQMSLLIEGSFKDLYKWIKGRERGDYLLIVTKISIEQIGRNNLRMGMTLFYPKNKYE